MREFSEMRGDILISNTICFWLPLLPVSDLRYLAYYYCYDKY